MRFRFQQYLSIAVALFFLLLPWQTVYIFQETFVDGIKWEYATIALYVSEVLLWLIIIAGLVVYLINSKTMQHDGVSLKKKKLIMASGLLILYMVITAAAAIHPLVALLQTLRIVGGMCLFVFLSFVPLRIVLWSVIAGSVGPSLLGIWQFFTQQTFFSTLLGMSAHPAFQAGTSIVAHTSERWLRAYGSFQHPNIFGGFLVLSLFCCLLLLTKEQRLSIRVAVSGIGILNIFALYMSYSRSAWIALFLLFVVFLFSKYRGRVAFLLGAIVTIFVVMSAIYVSVIATRVHGTSIQETNSKTERISGIYDATQLMQESFLFGVGVGNMTMSLRALVPMHPIYYYQPVHVVPLLFWVELGLLGVLLLTQLIYQWYVNISPQDRRLVVLFLCPILPLLCLDHYLFSSYVGLIILFSWVSVAQSYVHILSTPALFDSERHA